MSGGHFDYVEYHIREIAEKIREDIKEAKRPKPEKVKFHYVNVMEDVGSGCYVGLRIPEYILNTQEAIKYLERIESCKLISVEDRENHYKLDGKDVVYRITEGDYMDYPDQQWRLELKPETIEFMEKAASVLDKAYAYAHVIDYMMSGDSGEEDIEENLKYELEESRNRSTLDEDDEED